MCTDDECGRRHGGPREVGDDPVAEEWEQHLHRQVRICEGERQVHVRHRSAVGGGSGTTEQQRPTLGTDELIGQRCVDALGRSDPDGREVESVQQIVVTAQQGDGRLVEHTGDRHTGRATGRRDGEERRSDVVGDRHL